MKLKTVIKGLLRPFMAALPSPPQPPQHSSTTWTPPDFEISEADVNASIEPRGMQEILAFQRKLYPDGPNSIRARRVAPSIITRSEAELFGLSMPRFALRVYLDGQHESFVNVRRLNEFATQLKKHPWLVEERGDTSSDVTSRSTPGNAARLERYFRQGGHRCIADCVLQARTELTDRFHVLTAELGIPYGEGVSIRGTPFVYPLCGFGGEACGQACSFMCTALLHDHADPDARASAYGMVEITTLATRQQAEWLELKGRHIADLMAAFH